MVLVISSNGRNVKELIETFSGTVHDLLVASGADERQFRIANQYIEQTIALSVRIVGLTGELRTETNRRFRNIRHWAIAHHTSELQNILTIMNQILVEVVGGRTEELDSSECKVIPIIRGNQEVLA